MHARVRREDDRIWVDGVHGWFVGDRESSVHAAQAAIMEALGEDISYTYLLGVSALAFRMQVSMDGLCPSSPHSFCGYPCHARSTQALPWAVRVLEIDADDRQGVQLARASVVASIDRGIPVQYGSEEDGVIFGYQKDGQEWLCYHPMHHRGTKRFVETTWPWGIALYTERKQDQTDGRELAVGALAQAIDMAHAERAEAYHVGFAAWTAYLSRLNALQQAGERAQHADALGNSWIYECLVQYRSAAASYLRDMAPSFEGRAAGHLLTAAELYDRMSSQVLRDAEHCPATIAPLPWSLQEGQTWSNAMRDAQIERLEGAFPLEREAIEELSLALASLPD